jgi:hypothetical protein
MKAFEPIEIQLNPEQQLFVIAWQRLFGVENARRDAAYIAGMLPRCLRGVGQQHPLCQDVVHARHGKLP